jgi:hypothetical protein
MAFIMVEKIIYEKTPTNIENKESVTDRIIDGKNST